MQHTTRRPHAPNEEGPFAAELSNALSTHLLALTGPKVLYLRGQNKGPCTFATRVITQIRGHWTSSFAMSSNVLKGITCSFLGIC